MTTVVCSSLWIQFIVSIDDAGRDITIVADDFDLAVPSAFVVRDDEQVVLQFGDEGWLAEVADLAPAGETRLGQEGSRAYSSVLCWVVGRF